MNDPKTSAQAPCVCRYLRSKEMYYQPMGQEEDAFSGGAYWCSKSQESFGPDGNAADRQECLPGRGCYLS